MPAGTYPAGTGFAGADPITYSPLNTAPRIVGSNSSVLYDLATKSVPRDANGFVKRTHWVDQAVSLAMGVQKGDLPSSPTIGNRLRRIKRASGEKLVSEVEDAVNEALFDLVSRGDITILAIAVNSAVRSQIIVAVSYVNLRLNPKFATNVTAAF